MDYENVDHDKITAIANCLSNVELEWLMLHLMNRFQVLVHRNLDDGKPYVSSESIKWVSLNGSLIELYLDDCPGEETDD